MYIILFMTNNMIEKAKRFLIKQILKCTLSLCRVCLYSSVIAVNVASVIVHDYF